jgi:aryl-alcohol dehydrogenase-like predicted oxidoreductase
MLMGHASAEATARYAARFSGDRQGFFRAVQGLSVSSLGLGTYLGRMDEATDQAYTEAVVAALRGGINFIDTSLNYRHQRSERNIGAALLALISHRELERNEFVVCTKAGYLVPEAIPAAALSDDDVVGGMHSLAPAFLSDQLDRSRLNLGLETIDVFYIHNPETQLGFVPLETFYTRMQRAFEELERLAAAGKLQFYGVATWNGLRKTPGAQGAMSIVRLEQLAAQVAGPGHRFRFAQLPFNLAMHEACTVRREDFGNGELVSTIEAATRLGITIIASASIHQSKLAQGLPDVLAERFPRTRTDAQRAIQFARSAPGVAVSLVGMSKTAHVAENLEVAQIAPLSSEEFLSVFDRGA